MGKVTITKITKRGGAQPWFVESTRRLSSWAGPICQLKTSCNQDGTVVRRNGGKQHCSRSQPRAHRLCTSTGESTTVRWSTCAQLKATKLIVRKVLKHSKGILGRCRTHTCQDTVEIPRFVQAPFTRVGGSKYQSRTRTRVPN